MKPAGLVVGRAQIDEIIEERRGSECSTQNICRAKARACEERANETGDFIMKELWLWLAREWHLLANGVEGSESILEAIDCPCRKGAARLSAPAQERHAPGAHPGGELGGGVLAVRRGGMPRK